MILPFLGTPSVGSSVALESAEWASRGNEVKTMEADRGSGRAEGPVGSSSGMGGAAPDGGFSGGIVGRSIKL